MNTDLAFSLCEEVDILNSAISSFMNTLDMTQIKSQPTRMRSYLAVTTSLSRANQARAKLLKELENEQSAEGRARETNY